MILRWLQAFVFTQIIEVPIYRRGFRCGFWEAFGASALTHPLVYWFVASGVWRVAWSWRAAAAESFAWGVEALYFAVLGRRRAGLWSLLANGASFGTGMLAWWLFQRRP